ncbi:hypothetical protein [Herpetosiphon geysericola]|uniref:Uncharacterized protein n=1 Tax=Herpetosiphon geysericola TaxID=70996 RepID=A0A0N8GR89_9CHLR|nr:hypothetical protein [Herpetosiphon geysericola]KPL85826.1 hypothetical protein SE18_12895 [Herpetosiphon geysericola]
MNSSIIHLRVSRRLLILVSLVWPLGLMFGLGALSHFAFWAKLCFLGWYLLIFVRFGLLTWQHVYLNDQGIRIQTYRADYTFAWDKLHALELVAEPAEPKFMDRDLRYLAGKYQMRFSDAKQSMIVHTRFTEQQRELFKTKLAHYHQLYSIPTKTIETVLYPTIYPERLSLWQKMLRLHQPPLTKIPAALCRFGLLLLIGTLGYLAFSQLPFVFGLAAFVFYQAFKLSLALLPNAINQPEVLLHSQVQQLYVPKLVNKMLFGRLFVLYLVILIGISIYYHFLGI